MALFTESDRKICGEEIERVKAYGRACALAVTAVSAREGVVYRHFSGPRDRASGEGVDENTLFGIASMTKSFVCLGILKLREEGRLEVSDPVSCHIPEFTGRHTRPALSHLMSHSAGFYPQRRLTVGIIREKVSLPPSDEYADPAFLDAARAAVAENLDAQTASDGLIGPPGKYYSYCNDGFGLLSEILRREGGCASMEAYLRSRFLSPLGMDRTTLSLQPDTKNAARLYPAADPPGEGSFDYRDRAFCLPGAGGIKTCITDLERLLRFYLTGGRAGERRLLGEASVKEMTVPRIPTLRGAYGWGLEMTRVGGLSVFGHGGSLPGVSSHMLICPEKGLACAVLCNTEGVPVSHAAGTVLRLCAGLPPAETRPQLSDRTLSECFLEDAPGTYDTAEEAPLTVRREGDALFIGEERLIPSGPSAACIRREFTDVPLCFHRGADGRIFAMTHGSRMLKKR